MWQLTRKTRGATLLALAIFFTTLCSFSVKPGGEGFEIYLGNKLVLQQYGSQLDNVKNLQLDQVVSDDQLTIKYHHCGRVGKNRVLSIRDGHNKILKEWRFANDASTDGGMRCKVKDILSLQKSATPLKLYYSSTELPNGRLLASIVSGTLARR